MKHRGFTLIEIILYVAIASAVAVSAFQVVSFFDAANLRQSARADVDSEASFLVQRIHDILRQSDAEVPDTQGTSGFLRTGDGTEVSLADRTVSVDRGAGAVPLTSGRVRVDSLSFQDVSASASPDIIVMTFTMSSSTSAALPGASVSHAYTATISTR